MPRRKARSLATASAGEPPVIDPHTVYTAAQLRAALGLRPSTIRREVASGRLRVSRRAGRYWFLGAWVLEWLAAGELSSRRAGRRGTSGVSAELTEGVDLSNTDFQTEEVKQSGTAPAFANRQTTKS